MAPDVLPLNKLRFSYLLMHYSYYGITNAELWERRCSASGDVVISSHMGGWESVMPDDSHKMAAYDNS